MKAAVTHEYGQPVVRDGAVSKIRRNAPKSSGSEEGDAEGWRKRGWGATSVCRHSARRQHPHLPGRAVAGLWRLWRICRVLCRCPKGTWTRPSTARVRTEMADLPFSLIGISAHCANVGLVGDRISEPCFRV